MYVPIEGRKQECNTVTSNATCLSHRHYCYQVRVGARKALHWSHWVQLACACMPMAPSDPCSQLSQRKHLLGSGSSLPWDHKRLAPLEIEMCIDESRVVRLMDPLVSIPVVNEPAFLCTEREVRNRQDLELILREPTPSQGLFFRLRLEYHRQDLALRRGTTYYVSALLGSLYYM